MIWKAIIAMLGTSEFWVTVGQAVVEATHSPVPTEYKGFAWAYVIFRVVSKLAQFIFPVAGSGWFKGGTK